MINFCPICVAVYTHQHCAHNYKCKDSTEFVFRCIILYYSIPLGPQVKEYPGLATDESDLKVRCRELPDDFIIGGMFEPQNLPRVLEPVEFLPSLIIT